MKDRVIKISSKELTAAFVDRMMAKFARLVEEDDKKPITFLFEGDCVGGDMEPVLQFVYLIQASGVPIRTRNSGFVHSAATILFLSGNKRWGTKESRFNFHPFTVHPATIRMSLIDQDFAAYKSMIKAIFLKISAFVVGRTSMSGEELLHLYSQDAYFYIDVEGARRCAMVTEPARKA